MNSPLFQLTSPIFWTFFAGSLLLALVTVSTPHIIRATMALMAVLMQSAFLYFLLGAEFIAGIQILVYVGGIVILIVYIVMLTPPSELSETKSSRLRKIISGIISLVFWFMALKFILKTDFPPLEPSPMISIKTFGEHLISSGADGFLIPFEVISILLLASVIGAIVIARKRKDPA